MNSQPFFTDKVKTRSKITLIENKKKVRKKNKEQAMMEEIISSDHDISDTLNKFFGNTVPNLKIITNGNFETGIEYEMENPVQNAINKFKNHPSIKTITSKINPNKRFFFTPLLTRRNSKTN